MPDFVINISTPANLAGAQATKQVLDSVISSVEGMAASEAAAGRSTDVLHGKLDQLKDARGRFEAISEGAAGAGKSMHELTGETEGFLSKIETGFGINIGEKIISGVEEIGHAFTEAIHKGVEYNAEIETMTIGLAATLRSVQPEKYLNFDAARRAGAETLDVLREKANALGVDFRSLSEAYSANLRALIDGGVTDPAKQITLVSTLVQAETSKGVTGMQALRDSIDIFNGRASQIVIAKELGLTSEALKQAAENGTLYQEVMSKIGGYQEAAVASADSYKGSLQTVTNELEKLEGQLAKPVFDKLAALFQSARGPLGGTEASGIATGLGNALGDSIQAVENMARGVEDFWERHPWLKKANEALNSVTPERLLLAPVKADIDQGVASAESDARSKQFKGLEEKVTTARDDKSVAEARKELEEAIAAAIEKQAAAQGDAKEKLKQYVEVLQTLRDPSYFGSAPVDTSRADRTAKQDADAYAKYNARPAADPNGDSTAAADKREKSVETAAKGLEKAFGFTEATARKIAEGNVAQAAFNVELAKTNKELDGIVAKEDKAASSAELASKLKGIYSSIMVGLPESSRIGLSDQPTGDNLAAVSKAVEDVPVGAGDQAALDAKKSLVDLLKEALQLQKDYQAAASKEQASSDKAGDQKKQHDDVLASEREEQAILEAKANGQNALADKLEKEKKDRAEIVRLMGEGLSYQEAQNAVATDRQFQDRIDANNQKSTDRFARLPGESGDDYLHRTGRIDGTATDTDPGGGLHSGKLDSGTLNDKATPTVNVQTPKDVNVKGAVAVTNFPKDKGDGTGGGAGGSGGGLPLAPGFTDPRAALANPIGAGFGDPSARLSNPVAAGFGDPAATLANARTYVPTFGAAATPKAASILGPATAPAASPAPPTGGAGGGGASASGGGSSGGDGGLTSAAQGTQKTAQGAEQSASGVKSEMSGAVSALQGATQALSKLGSTLGTIKSDVTQLKTDVQNLQNTVNNLNAGG